MIFKFTDVFLSQIFCLFSYFTLITFKSQKPNVHSQKHVYNEKLISSAQTEEEIAWAVLFSMGRTHFSLLTAGKEQFRIQESNNHFKKVLQICGGWSAEKYFCCTHFDFHLFKF